MSMEDDGLESKTRAELQELAKAAGLRANAKNVVIIAKLRERATPSRTRSPSPAPSTPAGNTLKDDSFFCPITHEVMHDPVTIRNCGHTFEKTAIVRHLENVLQSSAKPSCPTCRGKADAADLVTNFTVKGQIDRLKNGQDSSFTKAGMDKGERPRSPSRTTGGPGSTPGVCSIY